MDHKHLITYWNCDIISILLIDTFHRLAIGNPTSIRYRHSNENESRREDWLRTKPLDGILQLDLWIIVCRDLPLSKHAKQHISLSFYLFIAVVMILPFLFLLRLYTYLSCVYLWFYNTCCSSKLIMFFSLERNFSKFNTWSANASQIKILRVISLRRKISARDSTPCQNTTNEIRKTFEEALSCLPYCFYELERFIAAADRNIRIFN